jgi:DNA-directed RNA polymerase specialized sigma24 family protein
MPIVCKSLQDAQANGEDMKTYFPEMVRMARTLVRPGTTADDLTADEIMKRLIELGWRKEGDGERYAEEKRRR